MTPYRTPSDKGQDLRLVAAVSRRAVYGQNRLEAARPRFHELL